MPIALVSGSAGLIGSEAARFFSRQGFRVAGLDNDLRRHFFGPEGSTAGTRQTLIKEVPAYEHHDVDIRDAHKIERLFREYGVAIKVVIHTAGQPSHDWAARDPFTDFSVNAQGTLVLLESTRRFCPQAVFLFMSTNKVYGDTPNALPLVEQATRWEIAADHPFARHGIDETMTVDQSTHSLFGASKLAADVLVQEYGRYFGLKTACFRGGCVTGPAHAAAELHGFLAYQVKCLLAGRPYQIFGYKGKQVRDNLHASDLVSMFWHFYQQPRCGEVYNVGGGRLSNCSLLEVITLLKDMTGKELNVTYNDTNRIGDHLWWISDTSKFQAHYPGWSCRYDVPMILAELVDACTKRGQA